VRAARPTSTWTSSRLPSRRHQRACTPAQPSASPAERERLSSSQAGPEPLPHARLDGSHSGPGWTEVAFVQPGWTQATSRTRAGRKPRPPTRSQGRQARTRAPSPLPSRRRERACTAARPPPPPRKRAQPCQAGGGLRRRATLEHDDVAVGDSPHFHPCLSRGRPPRRRCTSRPSHPSTRSPLLPPTRRVRQYQRDSRPVPWTRGTLVQPGRTDAPPVQPSGSRLRPGPLDERDIRPAWPDRCATRPTGRAGTGEPAD
jgi:hypothetical protein